MRKDTYKAILSVILHYHLFLMVYKKKVIALALLIALIALLHYLLSESVATAMFFDRYIFKPFQWVRNSVFNIIPFSIGDVFYFVLGVLLTVQIVRLLLYLVRWRKYGGHFVSSVLSLMVSIGVMYLFFLFGWGSNYYNTPLTNAWRLDKHGWNNETALPLFDSFLVSKINTYAAAYKPISFKEANKQAQEYYQRYVDGYNAGNVFVKFSLFGNLMERLNIQGYYNPFTGEAQVNRNLPCFMQPFVICHEMAHQCGIAAEDDANLLSYAICTAVPDSNFLYSAYFNIWLYANAKLRSVDSLKSKLFRSRLNELTLAHIDTLRAMRIKYKSTVNQYTSAFYDGYLKLHQQGDGIGTYNKVTATAWALEELRKKDSARKIILPE